MTDYAPLMEAVAIELLGEPNRKQSKGDELRWGDRGSFMVNIKKGIFHDFEAAQDDKNPGGVLDLICYRASVPDHKSARKWLEDHGHVRPDGEFLSRPKSNGHRQQSLGKIVAQYDYQDESGRLHLQVLRYEPKDFRQRRRPRQGDNPEDVKDGWIWSVKNTRLIPYRLPELIEAIAHERTIFVVEGEKDVENLRKIGLEATCNIGGAGKWSSEYSEYFKGANVIVIADNDPQAVDKKTGALRFHPNGDPVLPGQDHAKAVCNSLVGFAASVRYLMLPGLDKKGDVSDWINAGGTADELLAFAEKHGKVWGREEVAPSLLYRAINFANIKLREGARYLVRGILPTKGILVVWGKRKCGKSFWMMDILLHVALGIEYRGQTTEQGKVIYLVLEGDDDYDQRVLAWKMAKLQDKDAAIPFEVIFCRLKLVKDVDRLIEDIRAQFPGEKIAAICIDTLNRSYTGSESSDEDMTAYVDSAEKLVGAFQCLVPIVHHCGLDGQRPRGHTALSAAADGQIKVFREGIEVVAQVEFLKGGRAGVKIRSEEEEITVGQDSRGNVITSLVLVPADDRGDDAPGGFTLRGHEFTAFKALHEAIKHHGEIAPSGLGVPVNTLVVTPDQWKEEFCKITEIDKSDERLFAQNVKQALGRASRTFLKFNLIGRDNTSADKPYVWRTFRKVKGFDDFQKPVEKNEGPQTDLPADFL